MGMFFVRPHPSPPPKGEGVDYCYRGKSLLPKLPAELNSFFYIITVCRSLALLSVDSGQFPTLNPNPRVVQRVAALAIVIDVNPSNQVQDDILNSGCVFLEDGENLILGDGGDFAFRHQTRIVIGDERDIDHAHGQLTGQIGLRVLSHINYFPAAGGKPPALRLG